MSIRLSILIILIAIMLKNAIARLQVLEHVQEKIKHSSALADPVGGGGNPVMDPPKSRKGGQHIFWPPKHLKKTYKCGVTGMTNEYFLTGSGKKYEHYTNAPNKYLHNLSKTTYVYHFPTYYM